MIWVAQCAAKFSRDKIRVVPERESGLYTYHLAGALTLIQDERWWEIADKIKSDVLSFQMCRKIRIVPGRESGLYTNHITLSASLKTMEQETGAKTISCAKVFLGMFMNTVQVHAI